MTLQFVELFGYAPHDASPAAVAARKTRTCPFTNQLCVKTANGRPSGACSVRQRSSDQPIICCPIRLYAGSHEAIRHVADICFGSPVKLISNVADTAKGFNNVIAFGKGYAGELQIPSPGRERGGFAVDWILALLSPQLAVEKIAAVEVQTIDTTGSYGVLVEKLVSDQVSRDTYHEMWADAGLNWENVNKRIIPQLLYKGNVLRLESKNTHGLFFVCPRPVHDRIIKRLGEDLMTYPLQPGALSFVMYDLGPELQDGRIRDLAFCGISTTTVDQAATALASPRNLPERNSYERAITERIERMRPRDGIGSH